jgi:hypothetical protein
VTYESQPKYHNILISTGTQTQSRFKIFIANKIYVFNLLIFLLTGSSSSFPLIRLFEYCNRLKLFVQYTYVVHVCK